MIRFDRAVRVLLDYVQRRRDQFVKDPQINVRAVGRDLYRDRARTQQCSSKEAPRGRQVTPRRQQDVDDLAMLIDGPVEIGPPAGDLHIGLVGEPPVTGSMAAWPRSLDELRGEPLHPPVHADVVNGDTAFGQQFLDIPVGQPVPQVPADRERDHLRRNRKPANTEAVRCAITGPASSHPRSTNATVPATALRADPDPGKTDGRNPEGFLGIIPASSRDGGLCSRRRRRGCGAICPPALFRGPPAPR